MDRLQRAREILMAESEGLGLAAAKLDGHFDRLVEIILKLRGKVVLTGVGKSGIIAQKIAATLSSTGTPALFVHSVEAVMGDLGVLSRDDILIAISNSGETNEVVNMVMAAAAIGVPAVAMTKSPTSTLGTECEYLLPIHVDREAGHLGLAPTTSTTVTLALGDALAMVLMEERSFTPEQFASFHPGGNLGRRLALKVADVMRTGDRIPVVASKANLTTALSEMTEKGLGTTFVTDRDGRLAGILTDGDIRRLVKTGLHSGDLDAKSVQEVMTANPSTVECDVSAAEALRIMEVKGIAALAIVNTHGHPAGIIHIHDILGRAKFML